MESPITQALEEARALLARRGGWIKWHNAMTKDHRQVGATSPDAVRFCMDGALFRACFLSADMGEWTSLYVSAGNVLKQAIPGYQRPYAIIGDWNDNRNRRKREVIAVFDQAIKLSKQGG